MAASNAFVESEKVVLIWTVENFAYYPCQTNECISSPKFFMKNRMITHWKLSLYPKGLLDNNYLSCVVRLEDREGNEQDCKFESKISVVLGKRLLHSSNRINPHWTISGSKRLDIKQTDIIRKRTNSSLNDTLTIYCDIWGTDSEPLRTICCSARTIIRKESSHSICNIKNFSNRQPNDIYNYHIYFASQNLPLFVLGVFLTGGHIQIQIKRWKKRNKGNLRSNPILACCKISLLDKENRISYYVVDEFLFTDEQEEEIWNVPCFMTVSKLLANRELYLPNDTLTLLCEMSSSDAAISEQIEFCSYHLPLTIKNEELFSFPKECGMKCQEKELRESR